MRLFLDCEWADTLASELVSIALVGEDTRFQFYAERTPLPEPTDFVRKVVFARLERGPYALSDSDLTRHLRTFFEKLPTPAIVVAGHAVDCQMLAYALAGFELTDVDSLGPLPTYATQIESGSDLASGIEDWFSGSTSRKRHFALDDARALRAACLGRAS